MPRAVLARAQAAATASVPCGGERLLIPREAADLWAGHVPHAARTRARPSHRRFVRFGGECGGFTHVAAGGSAERVHGTPLSLGGLCGCMGFPILRDIVTRNPRFLVTIALQSRLESRRGKITEIILRISQQLSQIFLASSSLCPHFVLTSSSPRPFPQSVFYLTVVLFPSLIYLLSNKHRSAKSWNMRYILTKGAREARGKSEVETEVPDNVYVGSLGQR